MPANLGVYDVLGTIVCETGVGVGVCGVGDDTALSVGDVAGDKLGDNSLLCVCVKQANFETSVLTSHSLKIRLASNMFFVFVIFELRNK